MACVFPQQCGTILLQLLAIGLSNGAAIALNAIGVTLVYGVVRSLNFAYGDMFALTTAVVTSLINLLGLRPGVPIALMIGGLVLVLAIAMSCGTLLNVAVERAAFRPFRNGSRLAPLIASIGLSFVFFQIMLFWHTLSLRGATEHFSDVDHLVSVPRTRIPALIPNINLLQLFGDSRISYRLKDLLVLLLALLLALLVGAFLRWTRTGRSLQACAQDPELAELCGINRDGAIRRTFAIGGLLAGASAFIFALYYERPFTDHGLQSGLIAFSAAVLGGIGKPGGAFVSGLLLGVLSALSDYFLSPQWTPVLILVILILVLLLRPTGLAAEGSSDGSTDSPVLWSVMSPTSSGSTNARRRIVIGALLVLGLGYPWIDSALKLYAQSVATGVLVFALLAIGLTMLIGFAGLLDLGYAAIFAIGGYTAALLTDSADRLGLHRSSPLDFTLILLISVAVAALFGVLNGVLTLRLRGEYLAIVTLALGQIIPRTFVNLDDWTGGAQGIAALPPPRLLTYTLGLPIERYYLALALVILVAAMSIRLARSRLGRAWAALGMDELAALSCGVPVRARVLIFVVSAAIAGAAGALFATSFSYVDTTQSDVNVSAMILAMAIIGGTGSVMGAIGGAVAIAGVNQLVLPRLGAWLTEYGQAGGSVSSQLAAAIDLRSLSYLIFGLILYFTVLVRSRAGIEQHFQG